MKKFLAFFLILILTFSASVFAQSEKFNAEQVLDTVFDASGNLTVDASAGLTKINSELSRIPEFLRGIFLNEVLDVQLTLNSGKLERFCVDTKGSKINSVSRNVCSNPSLKVSVSEKTLTDIAESQDSFGAVLQSYSSGKIKTEPVGFTPTLKVTFVNVVSFFLNLFDGLFKLFG